MRGKIVIAGIGPGGAQCMTKQMSDAFYAADIVIGARRMLDDLQKMARESARDKMFVKTNQTEQSAGEKIFFCEYRAKEIAGFIWLEAARRPGRRFFIARVSAFRFVAS